MNLYVILGVGPDASGRDIERAYRRLARKYHPDLNPGDPEAAAIFEQATAAFETLSDPDRRRQYDRAGSTTPTPVPAAFEFRGFDFSFSESDRAGATFGDLFAHVLRRDESRERLERGPDLHLELALSFEEALEGTRRQATVTRLRPCRGCGGAGRLSVRTRRCAACQGTGQRRFVRGHMVFSKDCPECEATGRVTWTVCEACAGEGVTRQTESVDVTLPPGLADGSEVRLPELGHAGRRGGPPGHLYVRVRVAPHPTFQRDGDDLRLSVPVAVHEAALGTRVEIPTPAGPVTLRVPPGTQGGQRFRLRGYGVPSALGGERGDLIAEVRLVMPSLIDERSKELFRELRQLHPEDVRADLWKTGSRD